MRERGRLTEPEHAYDDIFEELLAASPASITVHDFNGKFIYINDATLSMHGYSREEFLDLDLRLLDAPESAANIPAHMKTLREKGVASFNVIHIRKDGTRLPLHIEAKSTVWNGKEVVLSIASDISELEKVIMEKERVLTLSQDLICIAGMDGYLKYVNPAWMVTLGYSENELLGKPFLTFIHPDDHQKNDAEMEKLSRGEKTIDFENRYICKDGSVRLISWRATPIPEKGEMYCVGRDITDNQRNIIMMQESEERLLTIANTVTDIVWLMDVRGNFQYVSPAVKRVMGYEPREVIGTSVLSYFRGEDVAHVKAVMSSVTNVGPGVSTPPNEYEMKCKDGSYIPVEVTSSGFKDANGRLLGFSGVTRDIRQRRKVEKALMESEAKYRLIAENATDVVWVMDLQTRKFTYFSPSVEKLRGYTPEEALELTIDKMMTPESFKRAMDELKIGLEEEQVPGVDPDRTHILHFEEYCKDGSTVHVEANIKFIRDENGIPIRMIGSTRNITERHKAENALETINEIALEMASLSPRDDIITYLARKIKEKTGAKLVTLGEYNPLSHVIQVKYIDSDSRFLKMMRKLGVHPEEVKSIVTKEMYDEILKTVVDYRDSLTEASFGAISPSISTIVQKTLGIDRFAGIAYIYDGKLYGTSILAFDKKAVNPSNELLKAFAALGAVALKRKSVEDALIKSQDDYKRLVESIGEVVFTLDLSGIMTYVSPISLKVLGYSPEELVGRPFVSIISKSDEAKVMSNFSNWKMNDIVMADLSLDAKDGSVVYGRVYAGPIYSGRSIVGIAGTLEDTTEMKVVQEEILRHKVTQARYALTRIMADLVPLLMLQKPHTGSNDDYLKEIMKRIDDIFYDRYFPSGRLDDLEALGHNLCALLEDMGGDFTYQLNGDDLLIEGTVCPWHNERARNPLLCIITRGIIERFGTKAVGPIKVKQTESLIEGARACRFVVGKTS